MNTTVQIFPTAMHYAQEFRAVVDSVARERKYLASVEAFPLSDCESFLQNILEGGGVQFIAVDNGAMVGWCDIVRIRFAGFEHVGVLGMGVLATHRRRGIGRDLLETTMTAAFGIGMTKIELEVFASNAGALDLYQKQKFVVEGVKKGSRAIDGTIDDVVCMAYFRDPEQQLAPF